MAYRVLVVDDSKIVRAVLKKTLQLSGLEITRIYEAGTGTEALSVLRTEWVDVVFADVHMPEMDGMELVEHMSQDDVLSSIPVVIVSSDRNRAHIARLENLGIRAYIGKPFRPEAFRETVRALLSKGVA